MLVRVSEISDILGSQPPAHSSRNAAKEGQRAIISRNDEADLKGWLAGTIQDRAQKDRPTVQR
ncbi:MAG: hypothetical protein M3Q49_01645, partial [Actinomycetota bacterium]|nr:hypothetical protein [Actinomycetota bacterium]